jgi:single-strand DNA-binding protein
MSINKAFVSGNLTRDCETRESNGAVSLASFTVAVNERRHNPNNDQWEDYVNYIDCVVFGKRAAALAPYLKKGLKVAVCGKLRYSSWENKDGSKRSKVEVVVDDLEFMSGRQENKPAKGDGTEQIPF